MCRCIWGCGFRRICGFDGASGFRAWDWSFRTPVVSPGAQGSDSLQRHGGTEKIDAGHVCEIQGARALVFSLWTPVRMQPLGGDLEGYPIRLLYFGPVTAELDPAMREPGVPAFEPTPSDIALTTLYQRA
jgi:hypothetical protein